MTQRTINNFYDAMFGSAELTEPLARRPNYTGKDKRRNKHDLLPFIAWDGEGYTDESGEHHYMLFGNSEGEHVTGNSLSWQDCFPLLINGAGKGIHVIFAGGYDVVMMIKGLPFPQKDRLLHGKVVKTSRSGYRLQYFKGKWLDLKDLTTGKSVRLFDVFSFFSTSFVKACREYLGESPELDAMLEMKLKRDTFTLGDESVLPYWKSELQHLVKLMERLRELLREAGIKPRGWHGPGAAASALLSANRVGEHFDEIPPCVVDVAERAYYGGRFEQFKVGKIPNVVEYDIRSAYPKAITLLRSLKGCTWHHEDYNEIDRLRFNPYGLYMVSWDITKVRKSTIGLEGPLPWRNSQGSIYYPLTGYKSWYWGIEAANLYGAMGNERGRVTVHEGWIPQFASNESPFGFVEEMYETRARMKREGNPAQLAVKLGLNSLYGKLAQSKGAKLNENGEWEKPRWHNIVWAGWITAYTRSMLYGAMRKANGRTIAVETDAIFVDKPLELDEGEGLGQWERTDIDTVLYVHSGVYYALKNGVWKLKSRGVEADKSKSAAYWAIIFKRLPETKQAVKATVLRFGTNLRSKTFARWYEYSRTVELPSRNGKRIHHPRYCVACVLHKVGKLPEASYYDMAHNLTVPSPHLELLGYDLTRSSPFPFPWRQDVKFEWPSEWTVTELERDMEIEHHAYGNS